MRTESYHQDIGAVGGGQDWLETQSELGTVRLGRATEHVKNGY